MVLPLTSQLLVGFFELYNSNNLISSLTPAQKTCHLWSVKVVYSWGFQLEHIFSCQDTDLPPPHPPPAFKTDLPQRAGEGFSSMPWLILTCHWQVGTREFPALSEAFNLQKEKTIKVLVLLGRREGPAATLQLWHARFYITKKWLFCMWAYT